MTYYLQCSHNFKHVNVRSSNYNFRYQNTLGVPKVRTTNYGKKSFHFEASKIWNSLSNDLRCTSDFNEFKRLIETWSNDKCACSMCI
jgi:hypothetical protein